MAAPRARKTVTIRLPRALVAKLDAIAEAIGGGRSEALRRLIRGYDPSGDLDENAPFFAKPLPASRGAQPLKYHETRYDHVAARGLKKSPNRRAARS